MLVAGFALDSITMVQHEVHASTQIVVIGHRVPGGSLQVSQEMAPRLILVPSSSMRLGQSGFFRSRG